MIRKQWIHITEWLVTIVAIAYLIYRLATYDNYATLALSLRAMGVHQWLAILACIALMPVNMLLESWRWKTLMADLSLREAQQQVYYSKLAGLITPWRIGEYPARGILMAKDKSTGKRRLMAKVLSMGAVGSATMTMAIVITGLLALLFTPQVLALLGGSYIYSLFIVILVLLAALSIAPKALKRWTVIPASILWISLAQSFVRLACWCVQLALILYALGAVNCQLSIINYIPVYYLLVTITPNVPIVEVGIRGAWAIFLFGTPNAALAGVLLWMINTLLPCLFALRYLHDNSHSSLQQ